MDLETREALAFAADRDAALAQLLPGSADHDYYRCLRAQHLAQFDEAERIIDAWQHGDGDRLRRLQLRQWLYRAQTNFALVADKLRDQLGVELWHEADAEDIDPTRATQLAPGTFSGDALLAQAVAYDAQLSQVTDEGLDELVARPLDPQRRRVVLARISHTPDPALVPLIAADLAERDSGGFGTLGVHAQLTRAQLVQLAALVPALRGHLQWVAAVVVRMVPSPAVVDLELDLGARQAFLEA